VLAEKFLPVMNPIISGMTTLINLMGSYATITLPAIGAGILFLVSGMGKQVAVTRSAVIETTRLA